MPLVARWTPLTSIAGSALSPSLIRSSHALAVVGQRCYIFGGEFKPRTPVDADLISVDLKEDEEDEVTRGAPPVTDQLLLPYSDGTQTTLSPANTSAWPPARVGASLTAIRDSLYLWGGRGGKSMAPFGPEDDVWRFDTVKGDWEALKTSGDKPDQRSFHVMASVGDTLYLHAGCPSSGRLATLHSLDTSSATLAWKALKSAPEPARGGTVLSPISSNLLARFGGFAGYGLGGLDLYDIERDEWRSVEVEGESPEKRSVHVLLGLDGSLEEEGKKAVAVMALGEREGAPAELGHDGAGFFHSDAWILLQSTSSPPTYSWKQLPPSKDTKETPQARGWVPSASVKGNTVVFQGGLNEKNERLGDGWTLEVVSE